MKRALFLDRDGVINHDTGYTHKIEDFLFISGIFDVCRFANQRDWKVIVVTNQAGIGRGYYSEQQFHDLTIWMKRQFEIHGSQIDDVYFCPFHPSSGIGKYRQESEDRKPNIGMLIQAAEKHNIDLQRSVIAGDKDSDMLAGLRAGIPTRIQCVFSHDEIQSTHATNYVKDHAELFNLLNLLSQSGTNQT